VRAHAVRAIRLEVESANPEQSRSRRDKRDMEYLFRRRIFVPCANLAENSTALLDPNRQLDFRGPPKLDAAATSHYKPADVLV
jgi:hypothetical protein